MKAILLLLILLFSCFAAAQHIEDNSLRLDSLLRAHKNMHFYQSPTLGRSDSVWHSAEHFYLYFDTDSICRQFIRKGGYNAIPNEMGYLYVSVFTILTPEKRSLEIEKMEKMAKKYQSDALMHEVELQKIFILPHDSEEQSKYGFERFRELQHQAEIRKDIQFQIRIRDNILRTFYYENHIFEAFEEAMEILHILDNITDEQFAGRRGLYFFIGELYYMYGYNEQAVPLLKKALKDSRNFFDRSNLQARNTLGLYYREKGDLDASDRYFRSMLESSDQVQWRGEYDAIAICNLGKNYLLRKDYKKAEMLLQKGLPIMTYDPTFALGVYISLGDCYLAQGNLPQAKVMIDSAQKDINIYPSWGPPNINFYPLLSKYYAAVGNAKASAAYMDSTVRQHNEYMDKYNVSKIFQVEKKLYESEKTATAAQLKVEKIEKQKYRNILIGVLLIISLFVGFYMLYIRLRKQKNRILYKRIMEERPAIVHKNTLLQRLEELMQTEQLFTDPDISRQEVANRLSTNETYLINAIKDGYSGHTFSDYLNSLRLVFACRQLKEKPEDSIKKISFDAGFASYKYFHQLFYEKIGMSPSDFRSVAKE